MPDKALKAAVALAAVMSKSDDEAVRNLKRVEDDTTKGFSKLDADIDTIREDASTLETDAAVLKGMGGVPLTMVTALFLKAFFP